MDFHRPDLIDYYALDKSDHKGNTALAFKIATEEIGIPALLDVEDVCDVKNPDERSLMTYIAYWFHAFSQLERIETAGRRVEKFVEVMQGAWEMQHGFEKRMTEVSIPFPSGGVFFFFFLLKFCPNGRLVIEADARDPSTVVDSNICRNICGRQTAVSTVLVV